MHSITSLGRMKLSVNHFSPSIRTRLPSTSGPNAARFQHTISLLGQFLYVFGGRSDNDRDSCPDIPAESYDISKTLLWILILLLSSLHISIKVPDHVNRRLLNMMYLVFKFYGIN